MQIKKVAILVLRWGGLAAFGYAGYVFYQLNRDQISAIELDKTELVWFYLALFISFVLRGAMQQALVTPFHVRLKHWERLGLTAIPTVANLLLPANAGSLYKLTYLGSVHNVRWMDVGIYLIISWIMMTVTDSLTGLAALMTIDPHISLPALFLVGMFGACVAIFFIPTDFAFVRNNKYFKMAHDSWSIFKTQPRVAVEVFVVSFLLSLSNASIIWTASRVIHFEMSYAQALLLAAMHNISTMVTLTPGSLGVTEAMLGASSAYLGLGSVVGVTLSLLVRVGTLSLALVMAPLFYIPMQLAPKVSSAKPNASN